MNDNETQIKAIAEKLKQADTVGVVCHVSPDPDTLGAAFASAGALDQIGKSCYIFCDDNIPDKYLAMPGGRFYCKDLTLASSCDVILAVDCGDRQRLGCVADYIKEQPLLVIDHHGTNHGFGRLNAVFPQAGSVCEVMDQLIDALEVVLTKDMASALYMGILTDTGRFGFQSTTPQSLRAAARMMEAGADFEMIVREEYRTRSLARTRLLGEALRTLELTSNDQIAVMVVTRQMMEACGAADYMTDGIVNYAIEIQQVRVGALIRETGNDQWKVSLRSQDTFYVDDIAKSFGGGGHQYASGYTANGTLKTVRSVLMAALEERLGVL